tara:strand:- start:2611 stop:3417 length:807 start_codon:yes stop_codon:yes gene_type:complete
MVNFQINGNSIELSSSKKVNTPLLVCSHERSGTHFMMNSIAKCTHYTVSPYLNFDYMPLGSFVNFFSEKSINNFLKIIKNVRLSDSNNACTNSIIKSHFPLSLLGDGKRNLCKIVYIYRNPEEVFISYWKFLHRWDWFEGPKLDSPVDLMKIQPRGQSQRYQIETYDNYFSRWASHIINAEKVKRNFPNLVLINYSELKNNYKKTIKYICNQLEIDVISPPTKPDKNNYIQGSDMNISYKEKQLMNTFIKEEIQKFPNLPKDIKDLFN